MPLGDRRSALVSIAALAVAVYPLTGAAAASSTTVLDYRDPLAGIYNLPASSVPNDVPVNYYSPAASRSARSVLTMGLVPGANFGSLRRYHEAMARESFLGTNAAVVQDLDTQTVLGRAVDVLKNRYPWLELMDDVAMAQERNVSLTLVLDIRSILGSRRGETTVAQFDVIVFDEQRKPVSRIAVEGKATINESNGYAFQAASTRGLEALQAKAKRYLT
jgi:hypothetical protein